MSMYQTMRELEISIHVPRVGDDLVAFILCKLFKKFQSTSPVWGTTDGTLSAAIQEVFQSTSPVWGTTVPCYNYQPGDKVISIHVPRVGDDFADAFISTAGADFNPRPPCGGRHLPGGLSSRWRIFQSTSPVWGTT